MNQASKTSINCLNSNSFCLPLRHFYINLCLPFSLTLLGRNIRRRRSGINAKVVPWAWRAVWMSGLPTAMFPAARHHTASPDTLEPLRSRHTLFTSSQNSSTCDKLSVYFYHYIDVSFLLEGICVVNSIFALQIKFLYSTPLVAFLLTFPVFIVNIFLSNIIIVNV